MLQQVPLGPLRGLAAARRVRARRSAAVCARSSASASLRVERPGVAGRSRRWCSTTTSRRSTAAVVDIVVERIARAPHCPSRQGPPSAPPPPNLPSRHARARYTRTFRPDPRLRMANAAKIRKSRSWSRARLRCTLDGPRARHPAASRRRARPARPRPGTRSCSARHAPLDPRRARARRAEVDAIVCLLFDPIDAGGAGGGRCGSAAGRRQRRRRLRQHRRRCSRGRLGHRGVQHPRCARRDHRRPRVPPDPRGARGGRPTPRPTSAPGGGRAGASTPTTASTCTARTLGIVGFGRIGQAVARPRRGFGMEVIHHTRHDTGITGWVADLDDLLARADVVSLHVPLTDATRNLIDARRLALMKPHRGAREHRRGLGGRRGGARRSRSRTGTIFAAGLDVYQREPEVHPRLLAAPHTVLLPHIGSATRRHPARGWRSSRARVSSPCSPAAPAQPRLRLTAVNGERRAPATPQPGRRSWRRERDLNPRGGSSAPYSLSRRALSAAQSSLRERRSTRPSDQVGPGGGYLRRMDPVEALDRIATLLERGRAGRYKEEAFRKAADAIRERSRRRAARRSPRRAASSRSRASGRAPAR